jgi:hypothetical protein
MRHALLLPHLAACSCVSTTTTAISMTPVAADLHCLQRNTSLALRKLLAFLDSSDTIDNPAAPKHANIVATNTDLARSMRANLVEALGELLGIADFGEGVTPCVAACRPRRSPPLQGLPLPPLRSAPLLNMQCQEHALGTLPRPTVNACTRENYLQHCEADLHKAELNEMKQWLYTHL